MSSDTFFKGKNCSEQDSEGCWITYTLRWRDWGKLSSIYIDVSRGKAGRCPDLVRVGHSDKNSSHRQQEGCRGKGLSPLGKDTQ